MVRHFFLCVCVLVGVHTARLDIGAASAELVEDVVFDLVLLLGDDKEEFRKS